MDTSLKSGRNLRPAESESCHFRVESTQNVKRLCIPGRIVASVPPIEIFVALNPTGSDTEKLTDPRRRRSPGLGQMVIRLVGASQPSL